MRYVDIGVAICLGLGVAEAQAPRVAFNGRPIVLFIHGRGGESTPRATMARAWNDALDTGLERAGVPALIGSDDRALVYYASYFAPGYQPSELCERVPGGIRGGVTGELAERVREQAAWDDAAHDRGNWVDQVETAVTHFAAAHGAVDLGRQFLTDVKTYLGRHEVFCDTNRALQLALNSADAAGRPVVLVAHSLGSLVAFEVFSLRDGDAGPAYRVRRFVTVGSQLGLTPIVPYLVGGGATPPYRVPSSITDWVDLVGHDDPLAWVSRGQFEWGQVRYRESTPRTTGGDAHAVTGYLLNPLTARAVAKAWCDAFRAPAVAPSGCAAVVDVEDRASDP